MISTNRCLLQFTDNLNFFVGPYTAVFLVHVRKDPPTVNQAPAIINEKPNEVFNKLLI